MESESMREFLSKEYQDIFKFAAHLVQSSSEIIESKTLDALQPPPRAVTTFHYVRAINLLDAIYILCLNGFASEALVLLRSLFNLYVDLRWLLHENVDARMTRYTDFEAVYKKRGLENLHKHGKNDRKKGVGVHDKDFERVKKKYGLKRPKDFLEWSGMSIFKMSKEVGLERDYFIVYSYLSQIEHTGPASVRQYLDDSENDVISIKVRPRKQDVHGTLLTSLEYFLLTKQIASEVLSIDSELIAKERQEMMGLNKKYGNL